MYAKITKDFLYDGLHDIPDREGFVLLGTMKPDDVGLPIRLLDDDRELYYEGLATDDALESVMSWAMRDSGCTILQVQTVDGEWKDVIS